MDHADLQVWFQRAGFSWPSQWYSFVSLGFRFCRSRHRKRCGASEICPKLRRLNSVPGGFRSGSNCEDIRRHRLRRTGGRAYRNAWRRISGTGCHCRGYLPAERVSALPLQRLSRRGTSTSMSLSTSSGQSSTIFNEREVMMKSILIAILVLPCAACFPTYVEKPVPALIVLSTNLFTRSSSSSSSLGIVSCNEFSSDN